jgi:hypothetical protein
VTVFATRWIRWSSIGAVVIVAAVAGWVSYEHALAVVRSAGEHGQIAYAYPATVDGLIYCASMVLLDAARRRVTAPPLARWLLGAGIAATLFANVWAGLGDGPLGAAVAAWPALALVGSYELLMLIIRAGSEAATADRAVTDEQALFHDRLSAARVAYARSVDGGNPFTANALVQRFGISRPEAAEIVKPALEAA